MYNPRINDLSVELKAERSVRPSWLSTTPFAILIITFLLRWPVIGQPDIHVDEQFYLLVASRMLDGALPYVDVWDRKPIGLFLLYAAFRLVGGDPIWTYQIFAALFVAGTAWLIWLICRRSSSIFAAYVSALAYIIWLNIYNGSGGQSPVFYNLLTAVAVILILRSQDNGRAPILLRHGFSVMLLCGFILQIKYTAVVEGVFFGIYFLWLLWKAGEPPVRLAGIAVLFCLVALMPTLAAIGFYAWHGHLDAFIYANFVSVFHRAPQPDWSIRNNLLFFLTVTMPLAICVLLGFVMRFRRSELALRADTNFLFGWIVAATIGFCIVGNYFDHYALPLLLALAIAMAPAFDNRAFGVVVAACLIIIGARFVGWPIEHKHRMQENIAAMTETIRPYTRHGCLYIDDAPMILYETTGACMPWRYLFPYHLSDLTEKDAVGTNTREELQRVIAARPAVVLTASWAFTPLVDRVNQARLYGALNRDYVVVRTFGTGKRRYSVHVLRDLQKAPSDVPQVGG